MKIREPTSKKTPRVKDAHPQKDDFRMIFEGPKMMQNHVFLFNSIFL